LTLFKKIIDVYSDNSKEKIKIKRRVNCQISKSHGGEYEAQNLLRCTAVFLIVCLPTFQRYELPPSSSPDDGGSTYL
jgi:hypothetical protein